MLELLKKIGLPATVAAVIASVITVTPFLFKLDERYAKDSEMEAGFKKLEEKQNALTAEVGKLTGVTQVLVATVGSQREFAKAEVQAVPPSVGREVPAPAPAPAPVTETAAKPPVASKPSIPLVTEHVVVPTAPTASAPVEEKKAALSQVQRVLEASQRNLTAIQKY